MNKSVVPVFPFPVFLFLGAERPVSVGLTAPSYIETSGIGGTWKHIVALSSSSLQVTQMCETWCLVSKVRVLIAEWKVLLAVAVVDDGNALSLTSQNLGSMTEFSWFQAHSSTLSISSANLSVQNFITRSLSQCLSSKRSISSS